jgi:serine/threonine protein kinase
VFLQLLDGVAYLHSLGIAHRDVKPENIVCSDDGTRVRLCDFGLATSESVSSEFGCGSTFYIAPGKLFRLLSTTRLIILECLGDWSASPSYPTRPGDVWSLGIILVNLVCGRNPWRIASPSDESFNAYLSDMNFLRRILPISEDCLYILSHIFTVDPAQRIDLATLREMILEIPSFSMNEEELRRVHLAAQPAAPVEESMFAFDEPTYGPADGETPSLRADSSSPSPSDPSSYERSRSTSSNGPSLPPTPLQGEPLSPISSAELCDLLNSKPRSAEYRIHPTTPDVVSATQSNPFFG